jgi:hypothetical protein
MNMSSCVQRRAAFFLVYDKNMVSRLIVFAVFASLAAFATHLFFGSVIFAAAEEETQKIVLRDVYSDEMHQLSGMVVVPSECHDLSVRVKDFDANVIFLLFETWEQPYLQTCEKAQTPRAVHVSVFAPDTVLFRGMLDNEPIPLTIVRAE